LRIAMGNLGSFWTLCLFTLLNGACTREAPPQLRSGARVQFTAPPSVQPWTTAIVGTVGECTAFMVPDDWVSPSRFRVVRIDSVEALRVSTRYDGLTGEDGRRRTVKFPPDTTGEGWASLNVRALQARYGACSN
jgi:hypothetical protein